MPPPNRILAIVMLWLAVAGAAGAHSADPLAAAATTAAPGALAERVTGIVHAFTIEDRVAGVTLRHVAVVTAAGSAVRLAAAAAEDLRDGERVTVLGRRNGSALFVESIAERRKQGPMEPTAEETTTGDLAVAHADFFADGRGEYLYEVHSNGAVTSLELHVQEPALQSGMRVRAHGRRNAKTGELRVSHLEILALPVEDESNSRLAVHAKAGAPVSVLVILLKFSNTASDPLPVATVQSVMSGATNSVANFFQEASFGAETMSVTVTSSWLRSLSMAAPSSCDFSAIGAAADAVAVAAGYTLSSYQYRVYMFPAVSACGWSGLAYIGSPKKSWINGASSIKQSVVSHEMGHNHSLLHAASLRCTGAPIGGACTVSEYGDPFNAMGSISGMHFNATQKALLGWIPSATVATHAGGNTTYTINPIEAAGGSLYAVKIPVAASRVYWLEYRQPIGFDAGLSAYPNNGAQIRVASPFETLCGGCDAYSDDTQLLDLTPTTSTFSDAALVVGRSFVDPTYGVTVNVLAATSAGLTVQVSSPGSAPSSTSTSVVSSTNPTITGNPVTFTATVTGTSPTGTVAFRADGTTITGCAASTLAGSGNTRTVSCTTSALATGSHSIVAAYSGDALNTASSSTALTQTTSAPPPGGAAAFVSQTVPTVMTAGVTYSVSVTIRNTGTTTWTNTTGPGTVGAYSLGAAAPYDTPRWNVAGAPHRVPVVGSVAPGATTTFAFNVVAPAVPGVYDFQWQMVEDGVTWFGPLTPRLPITVVAATGSLDAVFVSQSVPATMTAGARYDVSVSMRNAGTVSWTTPTGTGTSGAFSLGSQRPRDNNVWGVSPRPGRVPVAGTVAPGATATFSFNVGAPTIPGLYDFQWQMLEEGVAWFGQTSANVQVNVLPPPGSLNAAFVAQSVPSVMTAGVTYTVSVSVRNTGTVTWTNTTGAGTLAAFSLGAQSPADTPRWRVSSAAPHRVAVPAPVPPGTTTTISFNVIAPAVPGAYDFQWQMVDDGVAWFGALTPKVTITVVP